jgi:NhaA family Na+:H+ antiporter
MARERTTSLDGEALGGAVLLAAAALALVMDNSPLSPWYDALLDTPVSVRVGTLGLDKPLLLWINDGLMAIFFFLVGLEIKKEMVSGTLAKPAEAALPVLAAIGGMLVPALIYVAMNRGDAAALEGWAIPCATDIAFAVGVVALLGSRVPPSLKVFLLALAIIDDLGAILIIAIFYTANLSALALALAALGIVGLAALNRRGVSTMTPYVIIGLFIWTCVLKSGVHATLAGVAVALFVPMQRSDGIAMLEEVQHAVHPWVAFAIVPAFAFANAGISLAGVSLAKLLAPIPLGIALGLFVGKQAGILGFSWIAIRTGFCRMPAGASWTRLYGIAILGGIGFTMSLFIGMLAFPEPALSADIRLGVIAGSALSAILGYIVLRRTASLAKSEEGGT